MRFLQPTRPVLLAAFVGLAGGVFLARCQVNLSDEGPYRCSTDADCGGDGYVCTTKTDSSKFCCLPSGPEVCDGVDNDCNGLVDDLPGDSCYTADAGEGVGPCHAGKSICGGQCVGEVTPQVEICNQIDDNCDGRIDENFDLQNDPLNCGTCNFICQPGEICFGGECLPPGEYACGDNIDNDGDTLIDCQDPDCNNRACGPGCTCKAGVKVETACGDGLDNNGNGTADCLDNACDGGSCNPDGGAGCQCRAGAKVETLCADNVDNDFDTKKDCADSDCNLKSCNPDGGLDCQCSGGQKTEKLCYDGVDNDGDGNIDCADSDCNNGFCGNGCTCSGGIKTETKCGDTVNGSYSTAIDNDGDGLANCADPDCNGKPCGISTGQMCTCIGGVPVEQNCANNQDDDGDGLIDCQDPDCNGQACNAPGNKHCSGTVCQ